MKKAALVTGGARRVGAAIVRRLACEGFAVAFTYRSSREEAEELAKEVGGLAIEADLTQPVATFIAEEVESAFGRLDVLVNNASIYRPTPFRAPDRSEDREFFAVHYHAPLALVRRFEHHLRGNRGYVINMLDLLAERPWPEYLAYCASKAALANLTVSLARALSPEVKVNGISPGVVAWPDDFPAEEREKYLKRVPLGRAGTPEEVGALVAFLVSGRADYITGQNIRLDGGRSVS